MKAVIVKAILAEATRQDEVREVVISTTAGQRVFYAEEGKWSVNLVHDVLRLEEPTHTRYIDCDAIVEISF